MKIKLAQLKSQLRNQLAPIYIVTGEEICLKEEACSAIYKCATELKFNEHLRIRCDASTDGNVIYQALYNHGLLLEKKLLHLQFDDHLPNKIISQLLVDYAKQPVLDVCVLLQLNKQDASVQRAAWFKACEKQGLWISIWPLLPEQIPAWLMSHAQDSQLKLNMAQATYIAEQTTGNLNQALQSLEKMTLYNLSQEQPLTVAMMQQILANAGHYTTFQFVETCIAGDAESALSQLRYLEAEGSEPILILWALLRELRLLAEYASKMQTGSRFEALCQQYRIFFNRQKSFKRFLSRHSLSTIHQLLTQALTIDKAIKGIYALNPWQQLQIFCLRLS